MVFTNLHILALWLDFHSLSLVHHHRQIRCMERFDCNWAREMRKCEHENKTRRNWGEEGPEHFNEIQMIYYSLQKAKKTL